MSDRLEGQNRERPDSFEGQRSAEAAEWGRLEEIGDLHFHASAFSSALDYYQRLVASENLNRLSLDRVLSIHCKCADAAMNLGKLERAESLLTRARSYLDDEHNLGAEQKSRLLAPILSRWSVLSAHLGNYEKALETAKRSFAVLAFTDDHQEVASLQVCMGHCHHRLGRLEKAEELYADALATYRRIDDVLGIAAMYNNLALLHKNACRWQRALDLMEKAIALANKHGATHLLARFHLNQGIILTKTNRLGEARTALEKSLRLARNLGDRSRQAKACLAFGRLEILSGRLARAEEQVLEGKLLSEQERFTREGTIADEYLGDILLARGDAEKALFNYGLGLEKCRTLGKVNDLEGELLRRTAEAMRLQGKIEEAIDTGQAAIAVCEKCGEDYELGFAYLTLGHAFAAREEWSHADIHFRRAISLFRKQNLAKEWNQAILAFLAARLDSAGQPELLLLRRYLLTAQEESAAAVSDETLCSILEGLAEVQMRLGQFDDALLTAYELERNASGLDDESLDQRVVYLRSQIEQGLLGGAEKAENHLQAFTGISGLLIPSDSSIPRNLSSVLQAGIERVGADSGFIAMKRTAGQDQVMTIAAREGMTENLCDQLTRWFQQQHAQTDIITPCLYSRLGPDDALLAEVPALQRNAGSCVFMPIALHGQNFGLLFLCKSSDNKLEGAFDRSSLDFLATYMGFLALFLYEKSRTAPPAGQPHSPSPLEGVESFENIITQNEKMLDVLSLVRKVAPSDLTVLLSGQTGTGKGLLAYAIHALSQRKDKRFLSINCAAIPETLLESELFGHVKGSFTGADSDKRGLLADAAGGTVFLDEIGKMPLSMQGKLLHFLDTKVIRPVGATQERRVDVRIVCASKTDLQQLAQVGMFLEDLYFRLLDFPLIIPPLKDRKDDIQLLVDHFIDRFAQELNIEVPVCSSAFMDALVHHDWPGNVRELEKTLQRAIVLAQDEDILRPAHLPAEMVTLRGEDSEARVPPLKETMATVECREIANTLKLTRGNRSEAARMLKISYPNLLKKIRIYGIQVD